MARRLLFPLLLAIGIGCGENGQTENSSGGAAGAGAGASTSGGNAGNASLGNGGAGAAGTGSSQAGVAGTDSSRGGTSAGTSGSGGASAGSSGSGGGSVTLTTPTETTLFPIPDLPGCDAPYPHDPAVDEATGLVYYADSNTSCIGEFDPVSMEYRAWPTPTASSYPHGLVVDDQSRVFYTGQDVNRIGRLIPSSGAIEDFAVSAGGPHTPTFHQDRIWFTAQQGGQYGRFDRESGASDVYPFAAQNRRPYGMWPAPDGSLWVALFGANRLGRIDTSAEPPTVEEFILPNTSSRPRRIAVDAAGRVWYTDYSRRRLGVMDPSAPEQSRFDEYPLPSGGRPYGIAIGPDGRVWVDDEDAPEIIGFDPDSRMVIAQLPVPVPAAGPARNMSVDRVRNRIWLAFSNVGQLGVLQF